MSAAIQGAPYCSTYPYGQYSETPYKASNDANAGGDISCAEAYAELDITDYLTRDRWYGPQQLDENTQVRYNSPFVFAGTYSYCKGEGTYTYRDPASGWAEWWDGSTYGGGTTNNARFSC